MSDQISQAAQQGFEWMGWWYRISTPLEADREIARKTRILSLVIFFLFLDNITFVVSEILSGSYYILALIGLESLLTLVALFCNRKKAVFSAGMIISLTYTLGIMLGISVIQRLNVGLFSVFDLFVIPELLVAALLPPILVFASATINSLFVLIIIEAKPLASDLTLPSAFSHFFLVVTVQLLVAGICYVLVNGLQTALQQRDQAESVAELERELVLAAEAKVKEKRQLDQSIQMINEAQVRFANGDLEVRVPLTSNNILWPVAGALNNLFARLQRQYGTQQDGERLMRAVHDLQIILQKQRQGKAIPLYQPSGTIVDQLAASLLPSHIFEREGMQPGQRRPDQQ